MTPLWHDIKQYNSLLGHIIGFVPKNKQIQALIMANIRHIICHAIQYNKPDNPYPALMKTTWWCDALYDITLKQYRHHPIIQACRDMAITDEILHNIIAWIQAEQGLVDADPFRDEASYNNFLTTQYYSHQLYFNDVACDSELDNIIKQCAIIERELELYYAYDKYIHYGHNITPIAQRATIHKPGQNPTALYKQYMSYRPMIKRHSSVMRSPLMMHIYMLYHTKGQLWPDYRYKWRLIQYYVTL